MYYLTGYHDDTQKDRAITAATEWIDKITEQDFDYNETAAKTFNGNPRDGSFIKVSPRIISITTLETRVDTDSDWTEADIDDITFGEGWVRYNGGILPAGTDTIRITGEWGWASVPAIIKEVCAQIATLILNGMFGQALGVSTQTNKVIGMTDIVSIQRVLNKYKLHKIVGGVLHGRNDSDVSTEDLDVVEDTLDDDD